MRHYNPSDAEAQAFPLSERFKKILPQNKNELETLI